VTPVVVRAYLQDVVDRLIENATLPSLIVPDGERC
jgi:hypothetical protein